MQNHRDTIAMTMIAMWAGSKGIHWWTNRLDDDYCLQHVYTDDESDVSFRDKTNKTDGAVKRKLILAYAEKIRLMRAEKERAAQLDAYNYLNGKNLSL